MEIFINLGQSLANMYGSNNKAAVVADNELRQGNIGKNDDRH